MFKGDPIGDTEYEARTILVYILAALGSVTHDSMQRNQRQSYLIFGAILLVVLFLVFWLRYRTQESAHRTLPPDTANREPPRTLARGENGVNFEQSTFDLTAAPGAPQSLLHGQALAGGPPQCVVSVDGARQ